MLTSSSIVALAGNEQGFVSVWAFEKLMLNNLKMLI